MAAAACEATSSRSSSSARVNSRSVRLLREKEVAEVCAAVTDRRCQKGLRQDRVRDDAERAGAGGEVGEPQRLLSAAHLLDEPASGLVGETRSHEIPRLPGLAEDRDGAAAGAGYPAGAFQRLAQDGCEVGTFTDARVGLAQPGDAGAQCLDLLLPFVVVVQRFTLLLRATRQWVGTGAA